MQFNRQTGDFLIYLTGSLVVALVAIIKLPVFTSHFTPAEFGVFTLVSITYTYLSITLYGWITSCLYRYYHEFTDKGEEGYLYSNITFLFILSSVVLMLLSLIWYFIAGNSTICRLVVLAFCYLFTNQLFSMFLVIYKIEGKAFHYNFYQIAQSVFSLILILLMIFYTSLGIQVLFTGQIVISLILLVILFIQNHGIVSKLRFGMVSRVLIRKLLRYGSVGLISSAGIFILISSDRYIIALYDSTSHVGIYNQVYQVGQVSVYFLVTVFFNTITPGFNKLLTGFTRKNEKQLMNYVYAFVLLILPLTFYVSIFARQVAEFLLGKEFRQGFAMIPWIVISSFLYGLTLFNETKMKFEHQFRPVLWGVIIACLLNAALNFMFVPVWGYSWAAISTFIAYLFLFIYYYAKDDFPYLRDKGLIRIVLISITILLGEMAVDTMIRKGFSIDLNKWLTLVEGSVFLGIYTGLVIYFKLLPNQIDISSNQ